MKRLIIAILLLSSLLWAGDLAVDGTTTVIDGTFDTACGVNWNCNTDWVIAGGTASLTASTADLVQANVGIIGKTYLVTYTISNYSAGTIRFELGNNLGAGATRSADGTYTEEMVSTGTANGQFDALTAFTGSIDNVVVTDITNKVSVYNEDGTLTCDTAGFAHIASTQAYGEWTFDLYKGGGATNVKIHFIQNTNDASDDGYSMWFNSAEQIKFYLWTNGAIASQLFTTVVDYIVINTWYSIKITRASGTGVFTAYIQGGDFGESWQLIDVTGGGGTNPITNNTYTVSTHFPLDNDAGDKIRRINAGTHLDVRDFTISTGAYTTSGTYFETIPIAYNSLNKGKVFDMPMTSVYTQSATVLSDLAGENWGTITGTVTIGTDGCDFQGSNDRINANDISSKVQTDTKGSMSVWIEPDNLTDAPAIMAFNDGTANNRIMFFIKADGAVQGWGRTGGTSQWIFESTTTPITVDNWHHIGMTHNGTEPTFYYNGSPITGIFTTDIDRTTWLSTFTVSVFEFAENATFNDYNGKEAYATYWNRDLSATEMLADYNLFKNTYQP